MNTAIGRARVLLGVSAGVMTAGLVGLALCGTSSLELPAVAHRCPYAASNPRVTSVNHVATLLLGTGPVGARVMVDGFWIPRPTPYTREAPLRLAPGTHEFEFLTRDGFISRYELDLVDGDNLVMIPVLGESAHRGPARLMALGARIGAVDL